MWKACSGHQFSALILHLYAFFNAHVIYIYIHYAYYLYTSSHNIYISLTRYRFSVGSVKSHAHHDDPLLSQFYELSNSTANSFTSVSLQTRSDIECSMYGFGLFCLDAYTVHQNDGDLHFFSVRITVASQLTCGNPISENRATSPPCNPNKMLHAVRIVTPFLPQVWVQKHQNPRCLADNQNRAPDLPSCGANQNPSLCQRSASVPKVLQVVCISWSSYLRVLPPKSSQFQ